MPRHARRLDVTACGVMAHEAIHIGFGFEIKILVLPAIAYMAGIAEGVIGRDGNTEIVDHIFLAQTLHVVRVHIFPCPVLGAVDLSCGLSMACQACCSDFWAGLEVLLQFLEFGVIGRGVELQGEVGWGCRYLAAIGKGVERSKQEQNGEANQPENMNAFHDGTPLLMTFLKTHKLNYIIYA